MNQRGFILPSLGLTTYAFIGLALVAGLFMLRMHWIQVGREEILQQNIRAAVRLVREVEIIKETIRVPYVKRETVIETRFKEIEKEVASVPSRPTCNVTAGWMRYHDSATDPNRRDTGKLDDPTDTGITETQSAAVVTGNYKAFHQVANDLTACRAFVNGLPKVTQ